MSEAQLLNLILIACRRLGLLAYHGYSGRVSAPGAPDLVIFGPRGYWVWELKSADGTLSPAQQDVRRICQLGRVRYAVITPQAWFSGGVHRMLKQIADPPPPASAGRAAELGMLPPSLAA